MSSELAKAGAVQSTGVQLTTVQEQWDYANMLARGQMLPDAYRGKPSDVMIAMGLGASMGLSPTESLYRINVIKGKPTASAELIGAQVRKAGHKLRISKDEANQSVTATIVRADDPDYPISVTRDINWARGMGLANNPNYQKQPMTMLTWRAITAVAREACPEALYGVAYTPDEMHDMDAAPAPQPVEAKVEEPPEPTVVDRARDFLKSERSRVEQGGGSGKELVDAAMRSCGKPDPQWGDGELSEWCEKVTAIADAVIDSASAVEADSYEAEDIPFGEGA